MTNEYSIEFTVVPASATINSRKAGRINIKHFPMQVIQFKLLIIHYVAEAL